MTAVPDAIDAARLQQFNLHPARHRHLAWLPRAAQRLRRAARPWDARTEAAVSAWLLQVHRLDDDLDWQMAEPAKRLFLAEPAVLAALCTDVALALHRDSLARLIDGAALRRLQALPGLDAAALQFALAHAPRGLGEARPWPTQPGEHWLRRWQRDGAAALLALLDPAWTAVRGRARLRFAPSTARARPLDAATRARLEDHLFATLLPRRYPAWP